jgi:hypothetical protein
MVLEQLIRTRHGNMPGVLFLQETSQGQEQKQNGKGEGYPFEVGVTLICKFVAADGTLVEACVYVHSA